MSIVITGPNAEYWEEVYWGRPHGCTPAMVTAFGGGGGSTYLGWHLVIVRHRMRVRGYQILAEPFDNADKDWRLFIQRADDQTGYPWGAMVLNSDTGVRTISASTNFSLHIRDRPQQPQVYIQGGTSLSDLKYATIVLSNVVILEPGIYWIGIARTAASGSPSFYGSIFPAYHRGLRDLMYGLSLSTALGSLDPPALTALTTSERLKNQNFRLPGATLSTFALCNIDVALLMDEWFDG